MSDLPFIEDDIIATLDRSTLERFATCPAQARYVETGAFGMAGEAAAVGSECHDAISRTIQAYLGNSSEGLQLRPRDIVSILERELTETRPDLQPQCIRAVRPMKWAIANLLATTAPNNILGFDGGEGKLSGQLARDVVLPNGTVRLTSELDFVRATRFPDALEEVDWKTGWANWSERDVRDSFQFQFHWWLVAENYPDIETLRVSIFNTRRGTISWAWDFGRDDLDAINTRVHMALREWYLHRNTEPEKAPTWPMREKCSICPCATACPAPDQDIRELLTDPDGYLVRTIGVSERLAAREKLLAGYVDYTGRDLVSEACGVAFGRNKPRTERKAPAAFYSVSSNGK